MDLKTCTCVVITGGHRVPAVAGCPFHPVPTMAIPTNAANPLLTWRILEQSADRSHRTRSAATGTITPADIPAPADVSVCAWCLVAMLSAIVWDARPKGTR
jgi:hypothetical protein